MFATFANDWRAKKRVKEGNLSNNLASDGQEFVTQFYTQLNTLYKIEKQSAELLAQYSNKLNVLKLTYGALEQTMANPETPMAQKVGDIQRIATETRKAFSQTTPAQLDTASDNTFLELLADPQWNQFFVNTQPAPATGENPEYAQNTEPT